MAKVLIAGGGFAGVVAAEALAQTLDDKHELTLVSHNHKFLFYPALVRLAFGSNEPDDVSFDIREAMKDRRIRFIEGEVARIHPSEHQVTFARGDFVGNMPYDFLVLALGRRLQTERVPGFFEHAHHLLDIREAKKFGEAVQRFHRGRAVIGSCPGARLPVPVFETALALTSVLEKRGERDQCTITIVTSETSDQMFGGIAISQALKNALEAHHIELVTDFAISRVTSNSVIANDGRILNYDLNMLIPPFGGPGALVGTGVTDTEGYVRVYHNMRVANAEGVYAAGDCVSFTGPKMGHMAVRQAEVAATNIVAELEGRSVSATYDHELMLIIDAGGESIFVHKDLWGDDKAQVMQSRFWAWAKGLQELYWKAKHA